MPTRRLPWLDIAALVAMALAAALILGKNAQSRAPAHAEAPRDAPSLSPQKAA